MPLKVGQVRTYAVNFNLESRIEPVTVVRETSVGSRSGYLLQGPMGESTLAWTDHGLVAGKLINSRFDPPLILLPPNGEGAADWRGKVVQQGGIHEAKARISTEQGNMEVRGQKIKGVKSTVLLQMPRGVVKLETVFQAGVGIVQQTQRTSSNQGASEERLVMSLEMVGGS